MFFFKFVLAILKEYFDVISSSYSVEISMSWALQAMFLAIIFIVKFDFWYFINFFKVYNNLKVLQKI